MYNEPNRRSQDKVAYKAPIIGLAFSKNTKTLSIV